ncbi:MAG TPA: SRPBCC family protein [Chitinophagaceae bacterium]
MATDAYLKKVSAEMEMTLTRVINAPREMVFKAWTEKDQLEKWWGPKDFTNPVCDVDFAPGGNILIHMQAPDGTIYPMDGEFHEIVEPERIVFTSAALDKNGNRLFEVLNTVTFEDEKGKTKLTLHAAVSHITDEGRPYLDGMNEGWGQSIDRLNDLVSNQNNERLVVLERIFNAPVEKVWQALTDINQMKIWYFPQLDEFKPEEGFETQFIVSNEGKDYPHIWKVKEVHPLRKISLDWKFGGYPGNSLLSFELFPEGNKTRLLLTHEKLETFMPEKHPELSKQNFMLGWKHFMDTGLMEFLEKK